MIERGPDRRWHACGPGLLLPECRNDFDRRALVVAPAPGVQGMIRPGFAEAASRSERRRYPDAGME